MKTFVYFQLPPAIEQPALELAPRAQAFIDAAGITGRLAKQAINDFVFQLDQVNMWDRFIAIYPLVGVTQQSQSINLVDPTMYPLTENGYSSPRYTSRGLETLGFDGGAVHTGINLSESGLTSSNYHLSFYVTEQRNQQYSQTDMGARMQDGSDTYSLDFRAESGNGIQIDYGGNYTITSGTYAAVKGFTAMSKSGSTTTLFKEESRVKTQSKAVPSIFPDGYLTLGAAQPTGFSTGRTYGFASVGRPLSSTQEMDLYYAIRNLQYQLGRVV